MHPSIEASTPAPSNHPPTHACIRFLLESDAPVHTTIVGSDLTTDYKGRDGWEHVHLGSTVAGLDGEGGEGGGDADDAV